MEISVMMLTMRSHCCCRSALRKSENKYFNAIPTKSQNVSQFHIRHSKGDPQIHLFGDAELLAVGQLIDLIWSRILSAHQTTYAHTWCGLGTVDGLISP